MSDPYQRFLTSTDLAVWRSCLDELVGTAEDAPARVQADALADALTVASYLGWLARSSGDRPTATRAGETARTLFSHVKEGGPPTAPGWRRCWAVALAYGGYSASARRIVECDRPWRTELGVLLATGTDFAVLEDLRKAISGPPETWFLPAVYIYAHALIGVGASQEAQRVAAHASWPPDDPLLLDLLGTSHQGLGRWSDAFDAYRRSDWPEHRIRAALVGTIAGEPPSKLVLALDDASRQALITLGGELDPAGLRQSAAFLNACRWQPAESWLVEFELGRLCFRRRQFAEADAHLSRAAVTAPPRARYAVAELRFANLTWLSGQGAPAAIDRQPEAITVADQVVQLDDNDPQTPSVLVWLAEATGDLGRLPVTLADWEPYDRADALDTLGRTDEVVDELLALLDTVFEPRAVHTLMSRLHAAGLTAAVRELAEATLTEAGNDLFSLWETCRVLQRLRGYGEDLEVDQSGVPTDWLTGTVERFRSELQRLSRFEFMDTIRLFQVARDADRVDEAGELLADAAAQAEDVSELVEVALQRRTSGVVDRSMTADARGLLERARALSRDRSERLVIARELLRLGDVRSARQIISEEKVLAGHTVLSHSEFVVALECAALFDSEQRVQLALRAAERLVDEEAAGRLGRYPRPYAQRLLTTLDDLDRASAASPSLRSTVADLLAPLLDKTTDTTWTGPDDRWPAVLEQLNELTAGDQTWDQIAEQVDGLTGAESFGRRLRIVAYLRESLADLQQQLSAVRPDVPDDAIPLARWYGPDEAPRVIVLCDRWRERILGAAGADAELRSFFDEEQQLQLQWDERRLEACRGLLGKVARTATALRQAYAGLLTPDQLAVKHPVLSRLFASVADDVARSSAHAHDQAIAAGQRLAQLTETGSSVMVE